MSPHAVNNFVSDLVLMAQAMEKLPQVERELEEARRTVSDWIKTCENVQADLAQSRHYAATLEQRVHDLEVARDDAELSFLEADERTSRALDFVKAFFGNAGALIQALEPPKAAPQADSPSKTETATLEQALTGQGWHEPLSEPKSDHFDIPHGYPVSEPITPPPTMDGDTSLGQREPDPTATATDGVSAIASIPSAESNTVADTTKPSEQPGPYHGKYYIDVPNFLTLTEWLAGGGTESDFHWRPSYGRI